MGENVEPWVQPVPMPHSNDSEFELWQDHVRLGQFRRQSGFNPSERFRKTLPFNLRLSDF